MQYAKREKENGERTHAWEEQGGEERDDPQEGKGDSRLRMARTYDARGRGLALENVKPTDSPIYRPSSEFAI